MSKRRPISPYKKEDLIVPNGKMPYAQMKTEMKRPDLLSTPNHFEMIGLVGSPKEGAEELMTFLFNNNLVKKIAEGEIKRDYNFQPIQNPKMLTFGISNAFGSGIETVFIAADGEMMTFAPSFAGSTHRPFLVYNILPQGGYEVDIMGRIKAHYMDDGFNLSLSIPNLVEDNFLQVKPMDTFIVHMSGLFNVGDVSIPEQRVIEREENGKKVRMDFTHVGLFYPLHTDNLAAPYYYLNGKILKVKRFKNNVTKADLTWMYVSVGAFEIEVVGNSKYLHGVDPAPGMKLEAKVWLQGQILELIPQAQLR